MSILTDKAVISHKFSKQPVADGYTLDQQTNRDGHVVTLDGVWADPIPVCVSVLTKAAMAPFTADADLNDLMIVTADGANNGFYQFDGTDWVKITVTDKTELPNKNGKMVIRYHLKEPLVSIVGSLNTPPTSDKQAWRIFPYANPTVPCTQFVDAVNKYTKSSFPSTGYAPSVYKTATDVAPLSGDDNWYVACYSGIVMFSANNANAVNTLVITCWEYIGDTLETAPSPSATVVTITRPLTPTEKTEGVLTVPGAKMLLNVNFANGDQLLNPKSFDGSSSSMFLFNKDTETVDAVYGGQLASESLVITYI